MAGATLERAQQEFVRRWGEMGATWGISRTMAEVHALLFIMGEPLCTDDIMQRLEISRGSTSMNLRNLVNWGLIRRTHKRGDRKEYFVSDLDAWEMFETITRERRRREVEPIIETIRRCREDIASDLPTMKGDQKDEAQRCDQRLADMLGFVESMNTLLSLLLASGKQDLGAIAAAFAPQARSA